MALMKPNSVYIRTCGKGDGALLVTVVENGGVVLSIDQGSSVHLDRESRERLAAILGKEIERGSDDEIARKFRRYGTAGSLFGGGYQIPPFVGLLDDPVSRNSRQSYFLQLADLNAYAAFRRVYPPPHRTVQIVPQLLWDELGAARFARANGRRPGPSPGVIPWPRP